MRPNKFDGGRKSLGLMIGGGALALILAYALFAALPYLLGPSLTVSVSTGPEGLTVVAGETKRVSYLTINGAEVALEEDGAYRTERAYPEGYTVLTALAKDRFGRTITKTISFVNNTHAE